MICQNGRSRLCELRAPLFHLHAGYPDFRVALLALGGVAAFKRTSEFPSNRRRLIGGLDAEAKRRAKPLRNSARDERASRVLFAIAASEFNVLDRLWNARVHPISLLRKSRRVSPRSARCARSNSRTGRCGRLASIVRGSQSPVLIRTPAMVEISGAKRSTRLGLPSKEPRSQASRPKGRFPRIPIVVEFFSFRAVRWTLRVRLDRPRHIFVGKIVQSPRDLGIANRACQTAGIFAACSRSFLLSDMAN